MRTEDCVCIHDAHDGQHPDFPKEDCKLALVIHVLEVVGLNFCRNQPPHNQGLYTALLDWGRSHGECCVHTLLVLDWELCCNGLEQGCTLMEEGRAEAAWGAGWDSSSTG